ncbi:MAG: hypothetical protein ACLFPV_03815 [Spirochaetaceae bacterium]
MKTLFFGFSIFCVVFGVLLVPGVAVAEEMPRQSEVEPFLQFEDRTEGPEQHMADLDLLVTLFDYADSKDINLFELFGVVVPVLERREVRLVILGSRLREATEVFELGGDRANALFPVEKVRYVELGAKLAPTDSAVDVYLTEEHNQFLEIADITLRTHYGFADVENRVFTGGFGAGVKRIGFSFNLDSIDMYELNKVAIFVRNFGRPKRWRIYDIKRK